MPANESDFRGSHKEILSSFNRETTGGRTDGSRLRLHGGSLDDHFELPPSCQADSLVYLFSRIAARSGKTSHRIAFFKLSGRARRPYFYLNQIIVADLDHIFALSSLTGSRLSLLRNALGVPLSARQPGIRTPPARARLKNVPEGKH